MCENTHYGLCMFFHHQLISWKTQTRDRGSNFNTEIIQRKEMASWWGWWTWIYICLNLRLTQIENAAHSSFHCCSQKCFRVCAHFPASHLNMCIYTVYSSSCCGNKINAFSGAGDPVCELSLIRTWMCFNWLSYLWKLNMHDVNCTGYNFGSNFSARSQCRLYCGWSCCILLWLCSWHSLWYCSEGRLVSQGCWGKHYRLPPLPLLVCFGSVHICFDFWYNVCAHIWTCTNTHTHKTNTHTSLAWPSIPVFHSRPAGWYYV